MKGALITWDLWELEEQGPCLRVCAQTDSSGKADSM